MRKLPLKSLLWKVLGCCLVAAPFQALAQFAPDKPVKIVHAAAPGGTSDVTAHALADQLGKKWNQAVIVEARPGASARIANDYVSKSPPDGSVLLFNADQMIPNAIVSDGKLDYDVLKEFKILAPVGRVIYMLWGSTKFAPNNIPELIEYMKKNPGQLNVGDTTPNGISGLAIVLISKYAGAPFNSILYKGTAPAHQDLIPGRIDVLFDAPAGPVLSYYKAGQVKALGSTAKQRVPTLPNVPAIGETIPNYDLSLWLGFWAPGGMPEDLANRISHDLIEVVRSPESQALITKIGLFPMTESRADMENQLRSSTALWVRAVREFGFKGTN